MANHRTTVLTGAIDAIHAMQEMKGSSAKSIKDFMKTYPITGVPTRVQSSTLIKVLNMAVKDDILRCEKGRYKIASKTLLRKLQLDDTAKGGPSDAVADVVVDACCRRRRRRSRRRRRTCKRRRRTCRRRRRSCRRRRRRTCRRRRRTCRRRRRTCKRRRRTCRRRRRSCRRRKRRRSSCRRRRRRRSSCRRRKRRRSCRRRKRRRSCRRRKRRRSCRRRRRGIGDDETEDAPAQVRRRRDGSNSVRATRRSRKEKVEGDAPPSANQQANEMAVKGQRRRRGTHDEMEPDVCNTLEYDHPPPSVANAVTSEKRSQ